MKKLVKIAQIDAIDEKTKDYIAEKLENTGILIAHDLEYPTICYVIEESEN